MIEKNSFIYLREYCNFYEQMSHPLGILPHVAFSSIEERFILASTSLTAVLVDGSC